MLLRLVYIWTAINGMPCQTLTRPRPLTPADSPGLGAKVTRDTGERPLLSNLRIYSPVKRAKPLRVVSATKVTWEEVY